MRIIIFGAGASAWQYICEMNKELEILCFIDNDRKKWGGRFLGRTVFPVEQIKELEYDYVMLAGIQYILMEEQLIHLGVDYKKIIYACSVYPYSYMEFMNREVWKFYNETCANRVLHEIVQREYEQLKMYSGERLAATQYIYWKFMGKEYDEELSTLNDKIRYLEMNVYGNLEKLCTDKYMVRKYIEFLGLERVLPKLYFMKERVEEIDWDSLPDKFVLKVNKGCGSNIICYDKRLLNREYEIHRLNRWMRYRHELFAFEWHYENIPIRIICEELLETSDKKPPVDYKYFCCNGKIACILVCTERDNTTGESYHYYFDSEWRQLDYAIGSVRQVPARNCNKPENLEEMNEIAEKLSDIFPFVRVDLYNIEGKIYFGELTFTPCGGLITIQSDEAQKVLGDKIDVNYRLGENEKLYEKLMCK